MKAKGYHDLDTQRPPEGKSLMVIQSTGWRWAGVTDWPMHMSWLGGLWRWEPSGKPSSTYPTHWRFRLPGDERFDTRPPFLHALDNQNEAGRG